MLTLPAGESQETVSALSFLFLEKENVYIRYDNLFWLGRVGGGNWHTKK